MSTPGAQPPTFRYGNEGSLPRLPKSSSGIGGKIIAIIGVLTVVALIFVAGNFYLNRDDRAVTIDMVSHERIDDETMRLWVDVTRADTAVPSYCIVTSLNYAMAEVGRSELLVPDGGDEVQRFAVDIPSRDLPVSGSVYGCSTSVPSHLTIEG